MQSLDLTFLILYFHLGLSFKIQPNMLKVFGLINKYLQENSIILSTNTSMLKVHF